MDLTEEQDVGLGMRILLMFHQGWEALMPLIGPGRLFINRQAMRDSMMDSCASHDEDPDAWCHWKKVCSRAVLERGKLEIWKRWHRFVTEGKYHNEPRPLECNGKCSCGKFCLKVFTHDGCTCSLCFERNNGKPPEACRSCTRPLLNYTGPCHANQLCPNCDAGCERRGSEFDTHTHTPSQCLGYPQIWWSRSLYRSGPPPAARTPENQTPASAPIPQPHFRSDFRLCRCGLDISACGSCGLGYAQRNQYEANCKVYGEVQTFGRCNSGPTLSTLDLGNAAVTQVRRLDETNTLAQRNLKLPAAGVKQASDDELDWEVDGVTLLQRFNPATKGFENVEEVQIFTPSMSVQGDPPPKAPAVMPAMKYGVPAVVNQRVTNKILQDATRPPAPPGLPSSVTESSGVQPSMVAQCDSWVVPPSEGGAPTVPEANDNAQTASLTSLALPRSRFANMTLVQQARVCMQRDLHDLDAVVRTDNALHRRQARLMAWMPP